MSVPSKTNSLTKEKKSKIQTEVTEPVSATPLNEKCLFPPDENISPNLAIECAKSGNLIKLIHAFEDFSSPYKETLQTQLQLRDDNGKSALDWCAIFGTSGILTELIKRGVSVNGIDLKGYTALHYAAAWDRSECVQILLNFGANTELVTAKEERAIDISKRYKNYSSLHILQNNDLKRKFKEWLLDKQNEFLNGEKSKVLIKKEKSTDCDSALIPLLCVHG